MQILTYVSTYVRTYVLTYVPTYVRTTGTTSQYLLCTSYVTELQGSWPHPVRQVQADVGV
jgi:hypothetical protein